MTEIRPADVLRTAADILEQRGWTRGAFSRGPRHCVVGAMRAAVCDLCAGADVYLEAHHAIQRAVPCVSIMSWNDAQRSKRVVIEMLRAVASSLERDPVQDDAGNRDEDGADHA